jgi:ADP-heptose:LPS heptosyltransferase
LGFLLTHRIEDRKYLGQKHEVEYNLDLVRTIGIDTQDKSLFAPVTKDDEAYADSLLVNSGVKKENLVVALHPWTSDPRKQWPIENFSRLSKGLQEDFSCQVVIIGGKDEVPGAEVFCRADNNLINLTGKLTLRQLAAFFKKCRMLISNDSGPVHLAAAAGAPVLAIFRNDIPGKSSRRWGPWGSGHTVIEKGNLSQITVDEVLAKAKEYLAK